MAGVGQDRSVVSELWVIAVAAAVWGALAGGVLPRAAYRFSVPLEYPPEDSSQEESDGWRRECPEGHPLRGWLGPARCRTCGPYDSPRTPYVLLTALLSTLLALATGLRPELAAWLLLAPAWVLLAVVDVRVRRLPDPLTWGLAVAAPALLGVAALVPDHAGEWTTALLGAVVLGAAILVLHLLNPEGMGYGDAKLAVGLGAVLGWYGWDTVLLGAFAGFALGAGYGGVLAVVRRSGRGTTIAFGPFLIAGAVLGVVSGAWTA
ncbi:prepilin peptidase [Streptomyces acidiscabies]|uniref:A24 family peptidase n=1 Tax=Streptomyces acidiscabies TaxID=42234 RepID=A0AAP6EG26_9ACTN|nr:A24 family peptidase [Streptomyces acidiscabies]MBP5937678.1 prepilin peptidase [Streptomyces sp. LBUM 1476]MBZ3914213.1 prepilin peptidase [Streptomyces acidiscabies]MDX2960846.1 A24 family peptidase [Streptomyces acidiscabies]MDX3016903.1 A24 family peptidase [Streptomyces acidiscabies]MDX3788855.1 A24 family peptidase [Streptomyces acidiscabies]